jgi:hypothetical protein
MLTDRWCLVADCWSKIQKFQRVKKCLTLPKIQKANEINHRLKCVRPVQPLLNVAIILIIQNVIN